MLTDPEDCEACLDLVNRPCDEHLPLYLPWAEAGGPNECAHGYARGIPCPSCDAAVVREAHRPEGCGRQEG
jgi:hypothetical protein